MDSGHSPYSGGTNDGSRHAQTLQPWAGANPPYASNAPSAKGSSGTQYTAQNFHTTQHAKGGYGNIDGSTYGSTYGNSFVGIQGSSLQQPMDTMLKTGLQLPPQHINNVRNSQYQKDNKSNAKPVNKNSVGYTTLVAGVSYERTKPQPYKMATEHRGQSSGYLSQQATALGATLMTQNTFPQEFQHSPNFQVASSAGISPSAGESRLNQATGFSTQDSNLAHPMHLTSWDPQAMNQDRPFSETTQTPEASMAQPSQTRLGVVWSQENSGFKYECDQNGCSTTFGRQYDLKRHYNGAHAINPTLYWCEVPGCSHTKGFPRRDKLNDHISKMHKQV